MKNLIFIGTLCLLLAMVLCQSTGSTPVAATNGTATVPSNSTKGNDTTTTPSSAGETTTGVTKAPATTPTEQPTTPPPAPVTWSVKENGTTCIMMSAILNLTIEYNTTDNKTVNVTYIVPKGVKVTGSCGASTQRLELSQTTTWKPHLVFMFEMVSGSFSITNTTFSFTRAAKMFPKAKDEGAAITARLDKTLFTVSKDNSYSCKSEVSNAMTEHVVLETTNLQVQAFMGSDTFGSEVACPEDSVTSNIVPIAVGAALAGLVVIVLIAYLIGRRRNQRGYESV